MVPVLPLTQVYLVSLSNVCSDPCEPNRAGRETRFRAESSPWPDLQGMPLGGRAGAVPPQPARREGPFSVKPLHPQPHTAPSPGVRIRGGQRGRRARQSPRGRGLSQVGDLVVKSVLSPFPVLGNRTLPVSSEEGVGVGQAGLGGACPTPGWALVCPSAWCPKSPQAAVSGLRSFCHPHAAAVVLVAMTTRISFIFNSGL